MNTKDTRPGQIRINLRFGGQSQAQERERQEQQRQAEERERQEAEQRRQAQEREWERQRQELRAEEQRRQAREHQEQELRNREQARQIIGDQLAGFTPIDNGLYVSEKTKEVAIRFVITYSNDEELWAFYQNHRQELETFIREKVAELSSELRVKEIQVAKGSIILTIIAVATLLVAMVSAYPAAKALYKDLQTALGAWFRRRFGPDIDFGFE